MKDFRFSNKKPKDCYSNASTSHKPKTSWDHQYKCDGWLNQIIKQTTTSMCLEIVKCQCGKL